MRICRWLNIPFLFLVFACGRDAISLKDFDSTQWKRDRMACLDQREKLSEALLQQKTQLLGHDEIEIVSVLGKPDENELYKRNEKFYYYYVQPARQCNSGKPTSRRLVIRFNAVGLAKEILVEQ
jgi:hypothetical protein